MKHHGLKSLAGMNNYCSHNAAQARENFFGRMFPDLPANYTSPDVLKNIGLSGGPMDGGSKKKRTQSIAVGHVFFGQLIDHDITLDIFSGLDRANNPNEIANTRTPALDLDCVYGLGPEASNFMYHQTGDFAGAKLLTGADVPGVTVVGSNDLARSVHQTAIIGDFRNDENRIVSQLQLALINFHNKMADSRHADGLRGHSLYEAARQDTVWHYQWAVINDFLPAMAGQAVVSDILTAGRKFYCGGIPYMPVEFSVAAYRFGHSMVPMKIQVQKAKSALHLFGDGLGKGFSPVPSVDAIVDWHELFDTPANRSVQRAEALDTTLAGDLLKLPFIPEADINSLATRNLLRGNSFHLPAGEVLAAHMGRDEKEINKVMGVIEKLSAGTITSGAPLWLYILAEAEKIGREDHPGSFSKGEGLGPVGARIVAEVIIGLLEYDDRSYLGTNRNWSPIDDFNTIGKMTAAVNSADI